VDTLKQIILPDPSRAKALSKMATAQLAQVHFFKSFPSLQVKQYYDVIHALCESYAFLQGVRFRGEGAHKELMAFVSDAYRLAPADAALLDELRQLRNQIMYEGLELPTRYISNTEEKIKKLIKKLQTNL
jgi:hypothetical protein